MALTPVDRESDETIDAAYSRKYAGRAYLPPMSSAWTQEATVRVDPR